MITSSLDFTDMIFNSHKVKFDKLEYLFGSVSVSEYINSVNIFINLESIIDKFHNSFAEDMILAMNKKEIKLFHFSIISNIINLAAHYRRFFTKNGIKSNIVLFTNEYDKYTKLNNTIFLEHYRERFIYDYTENPEFTALNTVLKPVIDNVRYITEYIENVYLVTTNRLESSIIPNLLADSFKSSKMNILITRDNYDLQYVNKSFLLIYPKSEAVLVTIDNVNKLLQEKYELKCDLRPDLITFVLSVIGDKRRGIIKIKGSGWRTIVKNLYKLFKKLDISEYESIGIERLIAAMEDENKKEIVTNNYMCTDIDRQTSMVSESQKLSLTRQLIDNFELDILKNLNNTYFNQTPINIMELNQF